MLKQQIEEMKQSTPDTEQVAKHLEEENQKLKQRLQDKTHLTPDKRQEENANKIRDLEAEIDILTKQIDENDVLEKQRKRQKDTTEKIEKKLQEANDLAEHLQIEIDNLKIKIQELEDQNTTLNEENQSLKSKTAENKREIKKLTKSTQKATEEKQTLEQVADEKTKRNIALESLNKELKEKIDQQEETIKDLEFQLQNDTPQQISNPPITLLGDSNSANIYPHLQRWMNQYIEKVWAPTLTEARRWLEANQSSIEGTIIVLLAGTNDLKNGADLNKVNRNLRETTNLITEAGANLIVIQLPPVYHPQIRAEQRHRDSEIINGILAERHGTRVAKMEKMSLHRAQIKGDGLHLTNESADIIAEEVAITIQTRMTQQGHNEEMENFEITIRNEQGNTNQNEELTTSEVNTTALIAAKIIGKGGERVKKIKGIYGVDINTKHQNVEKVAK